MPRTCGSCVAIDDGWTDELGRRRRLVRSEVDLLRAWDIERVCRMFVYRGREGWARHVDARCVRIRSRDSGIVMMGSKYARGERDDRSGVEGDAVIY